ncbi:importin subunit alpha-2 [Pelomyxa schiedti]|nr:importin subunit alpha-2 [Pelomyxa schiedti]
MRQRRERSWDQPEEASTTGNNNNNSSSRSEERREGVDPRTGAVGVLARRCLEGSDLGGDVLAATADLRKLLSAEGNPPIGIVVNSGVIPRLIQFMGMLDYPKLQYEAAWAITNVSSGTTAETEEVIKNGGVSALLSLLASHDLELCEQVFLRLISNYWLFGGLETLPVTPLRIVISYFHCMPSL